MRMFELSTIAAALDTLSRASDSELLPFVSQIKPVLNRLQQTLSCTLAPIARPDPGAINQIQLQVLPLPVLDIHISRDFAAAPRDGVLQASGTSNSVQDVINDQGALNGRADKARLDKSRLGKEQLGKKRANRERVSKGGGVKGQVGNVFRFLKGIEDMLEGISTYFMFKEEDAVGTANWICEHPLVVDLQMKAGELKATPKEKFRKGLAQLELATDCLKWEEQRYGVNRLELLANDHSKQISGHVLEYLRYRRDITDIDTASAGIRHGIKLLVIEEALRRSSKVSGNPENYADGLIALMVFHFSRCVALKYKGIQHLIEEVQLPKWQEIWTLATKSSEWFRKCRIIYTGMVSPLLAFAAHGEQIVASQRITDEDDTTRNAEPWKGTNNRKLQTSTQIPRSQGIPSYSSSASPAETFPQCEANQGDVAPSLGEHTPFTQQPLSEQDESMTQDISMSANGQFFDTEKLGVKDEFFDTENLGAQDRSMSANGQFFDTEELGAKNDFMLGRFFDTEDLEAQNFFMSDRSYDTEALGAQDQSIQVNIQPSFNGAQGSQPWSQSLHGVHNYNEDIFWNASMNLVPT